MLFTWREPDRLHYAYHVTITTSGGMTFKDWGYENSPKRAGARFVEEMSHNLIDERVITIQVQRFGDVGRGLAFRDHGPIGKPRYYTWNGISTTTDNGYIPALRVRAEEATS